jgi:hypothetical protein
MSSDAASPGSSRRARRSNRQREALRRARLRVRERDAVEGSPSPEARRQARLDDQSTPEVVRRRLAATTCGWCGGTIEPKARGRIPKWCSAACRQRAWEQSRAAASGRAAVEVVERIVEIPGRHPRHGEWTTLLNDLAKQLREDAIYDRDLQAIGEASLGVNNALAQRLTAPQR